MNLARTPTGPGEWRTATCKLSEDDNKSLLNIYVDVRMIFHKHLGGSTYLLHLQGNNLIPNCLRPSLEAF